MKFIFDRSNLAGAQIMARKVLDEVDEYIDIITESRPSANRVVIAARQYDWLNNALKRGSDMSLESAEYRHFTLIRHSR